jgi:uncharacterized protein YndB with AHSA1/START domain
LPRYAASRSLRAPVEAAWAVVADPERFPAWWPDVVEVDARHGLVPASRWRIRGRNRPSLLRRPEPTGDLLVLEVEPPRHVSFQLTGDRIDVDLVLAPAGEETEATLVVEAPWLTGVGRRFPGRVLERLAASVRAGGAS